MDEVHNYLASHVVLFVMMAPQCRRLDAAVNVVLVEMFLSFPSWSIFPRSSEKRGYKKKVINKRKKEREKTRDNFLYLLGF